MARHVQKQITGKVGNYGCQVHTSYKLGSLSSPVKAFTLTMKASKAKQWMFAFIVHVPNPSPATLWLVADWWLVEMEWKCAWMGLGSFRSLSIKFLHWSGWKLKQTCLNTFWSTNGIAIVCCNYFHFGMQNKPQLTISPFHVCVYYILHIIYMCKIKRTTFFFNTFPHNLILIKYALSRAENAVYALENCSDREQRLEKVQNVQTNVWWRCVMVQHI